MLLKRITRDIIHEFTCGPSLAMNSLCYSYLSLPAKILPILRGSINILKSSMLPILTFSYNMNISISSISIA